MKRILVGVKRVVDYSVRVRVRPDGSGVVTDGVKMSINPFDEIALEEALRLRERGLAEEVVAVSVGPADVQTQLRTALAMGADRAILVQLETAAPLTVARALLALAQREQPLLVILGKQAIDDDQGQTGPMLAALWDRPQATFASKLELVEGTRARVTREVDAGLETLEVELPAVVTTDLRLNEPRYVKLPDIMKAKKKPLVIVSPAELGVGDAAAAIRSLKFEPPPVRARGRMVKDAAELIAALKQRGVLA